jgi:dihydrofolate synthase/folylpolyglutamate synthase
MAVRTAELLKVSRNASNKASIPRYGGRLETISGSPNFLLDGAHNEMATRVVSEFLQEFHPKGVRMIFGCMRDKNYKEMLALLRPHAREIILTKASSPRSMDLRASGSSACRAYGALCG